jgi:hypothetical protein
MSTAVFDAIVRKVAADARAAAEAERDAAVARAERAEVAHSTLLRAAQEHLAACAALAAAHRADLGEGDVGAPMAASRAAFARLRALVGEG